VTNDVVALDGAKPEAPWRIAIVAGSVLLLELALIRQVPAEIRVISYFTNLVLMATFFGLGLGAMLAARFRLAWTVPVGLLLLVGFIWYGRGLMIYEEAQGVHYWLQYTQMEGVARKVPIFPAAILAFVLSALPFMGLGQALVRVMDQHPRLVAYGWDIFGSLAGTILFAAGSALQLPPWVWPIVIMVVWTAVFERKPLGIAAHLVAGAAFLVLATSPLISHWSPYYLVQHQKEDMGLRVFVNSSFHQFAIDWTAQGDAAKAMQDHMLQKFGRPYATYRELHNGKGPKRVLILGAGTGNDVGVALREGAEEVVAVEIDPAILELGKTENAADPYGSPKVVAINDDARHYLRTSTREFDLIVFGTLDSQTLLSGQANLRLENYVYTAESFADAGRLLATDGMVGLYYSAFQDWLYPRLMSTLQTAYGDHCRLFVNPDHFLFNTTITCAPGNESYREIAELSPIWEKSTPSVDDWPYLYLEHPTIAPIYIKLFAVVGALIFLAFLVLRRMHPVHGLHSNFLFLGLGFTLMEAAAIVRLALVLGSTWTVNALVFASVLLTIFIANLAVLKDRGPSLNVAWIGLGIALAINYWLPLQTLLELASPVREIAAGCLIAAPVFFAAICFSRLFAKEAQTGYALGINLVGAMAGGLLEYLSMLIGMRDVWLVAMTIYLLAWLSTQRASRVQATS